MPNHFAKPLPATARLTLGDPAVSQRTEAHLRFQLDHALARDAVHTPLDLTHLSEGLRARGHTPLPLRSAAPNRAAYLRRPDLGRTLDPNSAETLKTLGAPFMPQPHRGMNGTRIPAHPSITLLLADGLSALALERHALPLLDAMPSSLSSLLSPLIPVITNARVALADEIGELLHADLTVLLIGERPGLSSPDSLGVYITWQPRPGRTDAERNCISNIRSEGLSYDEAAHRIAHYLRESQRLQTTGIALKDPEPLARLQKSPLP